MRKILITVALTMAALAPTFAVTSPAQAHPVTSTVVSASPTVDPGWGWRHRRFHHFGRFGFGGFPVVSPFFGGGFDGFGFGGSFGGFGCVVLGDVIVCPLA